jgi:hypothetical protein
MASESSATHSVSGRKGLFLTLSLLCAVLAFLFHNCFFPGYALFSNDGPLGALIAECRRVPAGFSGGWYDLNTLGYREGGALPDITYGLLWLLGPVGYSKFYAAIALLILGSGVWTFLRCMGLGNLACTLGAIATVLNSSFFSAACWGVAAHPLTIGLSFFALAALADTSSRRRWLRVALAGLAVGMGVVEGADIGAIFSLYVAAFVVYQAWISREAGAKSLLTGIGRVAVLAGFAVFIAVQSLSVLITTQIKGVAGTQQDKETKEQHWDFATQWSLPKREGLGFIIPGLFGYRMDTPDGGEYWGAVGRDPNWDRYFANGKQGPPPGGSMRFSGGGSYAGVLVLLGAAWAVLQSFRKNNSVFAPPTRKWIWFWFGVFVVSLLLAFGRFAPFYQFFYALPYFSTIRNPAKFTYPCAWALVVLFSYGVNGLWKLYVEAQPAKRASGRESFGAWWHRVRGFDRRWTIGCGLALAAAALGWLIFGSSQDAFERYLQDVQFEPARAHAIAKFSVGQVGLFLVFFAAAIALVTLVISGAFRGRGAKWGGILLGVLLVFDLGRANEPWIVPWNYVEKYASNPIIDFLRQKPYEHRVASLPQWLVPAIWDRIPAELARDEAYVRQLYSIEWAQHHFLYYNIQSLDLIQMPRMPEDLLAYETEFFPKNSADLPKVSRHWELTNTRYLLGAAGFLDLLNHQFDPGKQRFRIVEQFNIELKPGITQLSKLEELTAVPQTNGPYALFEFTGALPRANLYTDWRVVTNDQAALDELASPAFDPHKTVLLSGPVPDSAGLGATNASPGEVKFVSYAPKHIVLDVKADAPSVLLLNDRFDPNWKVFVDGIRQELLRCNFLMRGVYISVGTHKVEFRFIQPMGRFYVSLGGVIVALLLSAMLIILPRSTVPPETGTASTKSEKASSLRGR